MENRIKEIIVNILNEAGNDTTGITIIPSTRLREDLGLDSYSLAELTVHIEDEFNIDIFEDGIVNTFEEILAKVRKQ